MTADGLQRRRFGALDGNVDLGERGDVLHHAILDDLEVVPFQVADESALSIEDRGIDLHVVDLDLEGDLRLGGGRWTAAVAPAAATPAVTARASPSTIRRVAFIGSRRV